MASLLEVAASRLDGLVPMDRQFICTGERYRGQIRSALPRFSDDRILGEPTPRDTVNAVAFGAAVLAKRDPDAVFAVLTADHLIEPPDVFNSAMDLGYGLIEADPSRLVSFGITPTYPATGFGYLEYGEPIAGTDRKAFALKQFVEKPQLETAEAYVQSGRFDWNAGLFIFHARTFLELYRKHLPESHEAICRLQESWGTEDQQRVLDEVYPTLKKTSVDYGIMEPAGSDPSVSIVGVKMDVSWLDVGSWPAYGETLKPDANDNRASGVTIAAHDSRGNIVISDGDEAHTIALVGCEDLIVVKTDRATLVMPRSRAQDIKALHAELPEDLR